jgi:uncharacterized protein YdeI (YjbR/CyaY-like superfamily)
VKSLKTFAARTPVEWRKWLVRHHDRETEVWLIFHKVHTGRQCISYTDALDEALCFGWIDSLVKRLDEDRFARKFTPRQSGSRWSDVNRRHYARLKAEGRLMPAGLERAPTDRGYAKPRVSIKLTPQIREALREQPPALENFRKLAPSQQRLYLGWINTAKREETKQRRLKEAIGLLIEGKPLGLK